MSVLISSQPRSEPSSFKRHCCLRQLSYRERTIFISRSRDVTVLPPTTKHQKVQIIEMGMLKPWSLIFKMRFRSFVS